MEYNAEKYYKGTKYMSSASEKLSQIYQACRKNEWTKRGSKFEYKTELEGIIDDIFKANSDSTAICNTIENGRNNISTLDSTFQMEYNLAINNDTSEMSSEELAAYEEEQYLKDLFKLLDENKDNLTPEQQEAYEYLKLVNNINDLEAKLQCSDEKSDKYENLLKEYNSEIEKMTDYQIKQLESKEELTEEEQKALNDLKYSKDLSALEKELALLESNPVAPPNIPSGRMTQKQVEEYQAAAKPYGDYIKKKQELKDKIKQLQKDHGTYVNKWYEDWGEAITKTAAEWKEGFTALANGEGVGELWDATKKTGATAVVNVESAVSGVAKIYEWVSDGLIAVDGTLNAGLTWLFHDIWSDNDLADDRMNEWLDEVRVDKVGEIRENFYENTKIGKGINEYSNLKYDSAGAKTIGDATRFAVELAIATAAEIGTFGAATPLVAAMFAAEGIGQATESYAQGVDRENGESYSYLQAIGSEVLGGLGGVMKGRMYGKMGANTIRLLQNPELIKTGIDVLKENGIKNAVKQDIASGAFKVDAVSTAVQKGFEGYTEYKNTGEVNWTRLGLSYFGELLYSRVTDNFMEMDLKPKGVNDIFYSTNIDIKSGGVDDFSDIEMPKTKSVSTEIISPSSSNYNNINDFNYQMNYSSGMKSITPLDRLFADAPNVTKTNLGEKTDDLFKIMTDKYGEYEGIERIKRALIDNNSRYITRDYNARQIFTEIDAQAIDDYIMKQTNNIYESILYKYGNQELVDRSIQKIINTNCWNYLDNSDGTITSLYNWTGGSLEKLDEFMVKKKISRYSNYELLGTEKVFVGDSSVNMTKKLNCFKIYDFNNNTFIYVQKNLDYHHDLNSLLNAYEDIKYNIPSHAQKINNIYITSIDCPCDPHWARVHNNPKFKCTALGGNQTIQLFDCNRYVDIIETLYHETGHLIDYTYDYNAQDWIRISDSLEWEQAVLNDNNWPSNYAYDAYVNRDVGRYAEDFSDSLSQLKKLGPEEFKKIYKNRAMILERIVPELFYKEA